MFDCAGGAVPATAAAAAAAARGFSRAFCICSSMAAFCTASAPYLPWPMKVSGGLWYTDASVESSPRSCSSKAGGRDWMFVVMGGLSERTTF